jgi:rhomboid family GlyGly-CTERM serine protease
MRALATKFRNEWRGRGFLLAASVLCVTQWLVPDAPARLRYERGLVAAGEWWRLASCHLVHYDAQHLAMNVAALALLWALFVTDLRARDWALVVLAAALAIDAGLYFREREVTWYLGLSGVLHGVWAAGGLAALRRSRLEGLATLALLAAKLLAELRFGALSSGLGAGLPVLTAAHRYGALGGGLAALALGRARRPL